MEENSIFRNMLNLILTLVVNALVLMMASSIFKGFYVETFWIAILTAFVIAVLNYLVKPLLVLWTLPITIWSLGIFYPLINVLILKLASLIIGPPFQVQGLIVPIIISLFISFMNILLDRIVVKPIIGGRR